jgi:hypothetical protein
MIFQTEMNGRGPGTAAMMPTAQLHRDALLRGCVRMAIGRAMAFLSSLAGAVEQAQRHYNKLRPVQDGASSPTIGRQAVDGRAWQSVALRRFFLRNAIEDHHKDLFSLISPQLLAAFSGRPLWGDQIRGPPIGRTLGHSTDRVAPAVPPACGPCRSTDSEAQGQP